MRIKTTLAALLAAACALAGCAGPPRQVADPSPCAGNPGGYDCQIERYQKAPG